ncbi:MAG: glyoxalase [Deltaproteobacteria bacterium]|nr:glyoxalase [Deltaproteobacteria bacterium]
MGLPNGVHHAAFCTKDIKAQIEFFSEVIGMKLVALYWMHGVEGAMHAFLELSPKSLMAFVQMPQVSEIESLPGITHAGNAGDPVAAGVLQHVSFNVEGEADLLAMRDRIRSSGIQVLGPVDHGFCKSIYLAGPEGLLLEFSTSETAIDAELWVDPELVELCGINADELARYKKPEAWVSSRPGEVPQPPFDPDQPHQLFDAEKAAWVQKASDSEFAEVMSETTPPGAKA